jgi:hypothetical protein
VVVVAVVVMMMMTKFYCLFKSGLMLGGSQNTSCYTYIGVQNWFIIYMNYSNGKVYSERESGWGTIAGLLSTR